MELTQKEQEARKRVCLALDVLTVREALDLAQRIENQEFVFEFMKK